jgi:hypothetical protein
MIIVLLAIGLTVGFAAARRAPSAPTRRRAGAIILAALALVPVLAVVALALSSKGLGGSISSGWKSLTDPNSTATVTNDPSRLTSVGSVRARYWNESFKIWRAHKLTGVGAGGYQTARLRFRTDRLAVRHAHGYVVQTAADMGLIGVAASLALLAAWLAAAARTLAWWPRRQAAALNAAEQAFGPERVALMTLATLVLVFGVHSFIDWTWFVPGTAVMALLAAGWVAGRGPLTEPPADPRGLPAAVREGARLPVRAAVAGLTVIVALLAAWTAWQPLRSVDAGNNALDLAIKGPKYIPQARAQVKAARERNPLSIDPLVDESFVDIAAHDLRAARDRLEDAVRLQPSNPAAWEALARFTLDQEKDPKLALRLLGPTLYLDPQSPTGARDYLDGLHAAQAQADAAAAAQKAKQQAAQAKRTKKKKRHR